MKTKSPHVLTSGLRKHPTANENAFAKAKLSMGDDITPKQPLPNLSAQAAQSRNMDMAQAIRDKLIVMVESYTGKPLHIFAEEVREWRKSHLTPGAQKLPFPTTAYN